MPLIPKSALDFHTISVYLFSLFVVVVLPLDLFSHLCRLISFSIIPKRLCFQPSVILSTNTMQYYTSNWSIIFFFFRSSFFFWFIPCHFTNIYVYLWLWYHHVIRFRSFFLFNLHLLLFFFRGFYFVQFSLDDDIVNNLKPEFDRKTSALFIGSNEDQKKISTRFQNGLHWKSIWNVDNGADAMILF